MRYETSKNDDLGVDRQPFASSDVSSPSPRSAYWINFLATSTLIELRGVSYTGALC
jgi:hypothetical protein